MDARTSQPAHQTHQPPARGWRPERCDRVALVLQGGGALGAYQAGVYQALHEAGIEPDWVCGVSIGAIPQRQEFAQTVVGIPGSQKALLGPAFVEQGILGCFKRECYRRGLEEVHRGPEAGGARRQFQGGLTNRPEGSIISGFQP